MDLMSPKEREQLILQVSRIAIKTNLTNIAAGAILRLLLTALLTGTEDDLHEYLMPVIRKGLKKKKK